MKIYEATIKNNNTYYGDEREIKVTVDEKGKKFLECLLDKKYFWEETEITFSQMADKEENMTEELAVYHVCFISDYSFSVCILNKEQVELFKILDKECCIFSEIEMIVFEECKMTNFAE